MIRKSCVQRVRCDSKLHEKLKNAGAKPSNEHCRFINADLIKGATVKPKEPATFKHVQLS